MADSSYQPATFDRVQYTISLKIKGVDYSADVNNVRIVSSITTPYQIITLDLFSSINDIILTKLFGIDPIKLSIKLNKQQSTVSEQTDFELMMINSNYNIPIRNNMTQQSQNERTPFSIITIPRPSFKTITTHVNNVYINQTLRQIITDLTSTTGASLTYDSESENKQVIDQVIIPPTTVYKAIKYLDERFGLYTGPNIIFCDYLNNLYIKNIAAKINKSQTFTIYQLALDDSDTSKTIDLCNDGKNFYTYSTIQNKYIGNQKFSVISKNTRFIAKPTDSLYHVLENDLSDICQNYGIISKNKNIDFDPQLNNRTTYVIDDTGYGTSNTPIIADISKKISNLSTITLAIERNLPIMNLMNVGESIKLNTKTVENSNLSGKYILKSSDIIFQRQSGSWQNLCNINLIRTNQSS